jgi:hypothetical protein
VGLGIEQVVEGNDPHGGHVRVCEGDMARVGVSHGMGKVKLLVSLMNTPFRNLVILHISAYEDGTECSEMSAYNIQMSGNYPEENIKHWNKLIETSVIKGTINFFHEFYM